MLVCVGKQSLKTTLLGLISSTQTVLFGVMLFGHISAAALNWQFNQDLSRNVKLDWSSSCSAVCAIEQGP